ncbi:unnamed protein product [Protopolystoma xenopodis]|uniref:Uncharacterized protein n=1 Tax=Protopolystoma xenopodis TaxID=117903 RepID=A0A3S4ZSM0_9PLAT|nr:unnamed protein product [Protopolystoma xenopodis]
MNSEALRHFGKRLTAFEHEEILAYPQLFFLGLSAKKLNMARGYAHNCGNDDENGGYIRVREIVAKLSSYLSIT